MSDTTKPALPEPLWAAVERYADEVTEYNAALKIDVGVYADGKSCLAAEADAREAIRAAIDAAVAEARAVPEGWKLLKDTTHTERSWPEDRSHENGNYSNTCVRCLREFVGHKRRVACKACAEQP